MSLDDFFATGHTPDKPFMNRVAEKQSFRESVEVVTAQLSHAVATVEDRQLPRRNVLAFYGVGGIGKTQLSRVLEDEYLIDADEDLTNLSFRIEFEADVAVNVEEVLFGLRAALGAHRASWPAFDLAFAVYWERAHPGVPLQTALNRSSLAGRVAQNFSLGDQVQSAVEDLLDSPGGVLGIFHAGAKVVGRSVLDRVRERRVLRECPYFEPVIGETDPARMRSYLAALLAWDLAQLQEKQARSGRRLTVTVFFDGWEKVQPEEPARGSLEDVLSRLAWLMPNALFVVTGRNRLRWAEGDSRGVMTFAGPTLWPYLQDDPGPVEPRQHLVGGLSDTDAERFLAERTRDADGAAVAPEIRREIIESAHGLPLYLEVAAFRFNQLRYQGHDPAAEDFQKLGLEELVQCMMSDLRPQERALLRTASLVSRFDQELLLAGSPGLREADWSRFVARPLVSQEAGSHLPYSLHECLQEAVRDADCAQDRWSEREWRQTAKRLSDELAQRVTSGGESDVLLLGTYFLQALRLASHLETVEEWIWQLAARLQSLGALDVLAGATDVPRPDRKTSAAASVLAAVGRRGSLGPQATARLLRSYLAGPHLDDAGRDFANHWLAWMLEGLGQGEEAEQLRISLLGRRDWLTPFVGHALGRASWVSGRLDRAQGLEFDDADPRQRFWKTGIRGRVAWILGRFEEADELYRQRVAAAEAFGSRLFRADAQRSRAQLLCFTDPADVGPALEAEEIYRRADVGAGHAETMTALVLSRYRVGTADTALAELQELRAAAGVWADAAHVFIACCEGDLSSAEEVHRRMSGAQRGRDYGFWTAITQWWIDEVAGRSTSVDDHGVTWLHGVDDARARWQAVLRQRRAG
jgi:hypothetical protein